MMAELTLGCENYYERFVVVVDSGGVVRAIDGFLYALPGVFSASLPKHSRESACAGRASKLRRALVKQKSKTAKVSLTSLLRASCSTQ